MIPWTDAKPGDADRLIGLLKGKRGAADDNPEVNCTVGRLDFEAGFVDVWVTWGAEGAKILKRAGWALTHYKGDPKKDGSVFLRFRADAFRGLHMAFKLDPERERQPGPWVGDQ